MCSQTDAAGQRLIPWIESIFSQCVYTTRDAVSLFVGMSSILFWFCAQAPQLYENFKNKRAESLSWVFLFIWLVGDLSNLLGCILTKQLPFQLWLAIYFVIMDTLLLGQWLYYRHAKPLEVDGDDEVPILDDSSLAVVVTDRLHRRHGSPTALAALMVPVASASQFLFTSDQATNAPEEKLVTGLIFAWISTVCYLSSRLPQIWKNYQRHSVQGLSILLFGFAMCGNLTYCASMFLSSAENAISPNSLPYLLGSGGTLIFDMCIFLQHVYYTRKNHHRCDFDEDDRIQ